MAAAGGGPTPPLTGVAKELFAEPFKFDFFQAVRLLERIYPSARPVGREGQPADEVVRFRAHLSLAFPPSSIFALDPPDEDEDRPRPEMIVTFMGLTGPKGVLPQHYTQMLMELHRDVRGPERRSLRDWFDLFNHRMVSLFYRAWEKYRFYVPYERGEAGRREPDAFTRTLFSLVGLGTRGLQNRLRVATPTPQLDEAGRDEHVLARIDDLALLHYAGFFAQRPRNATNLAALLGDYFGLPVKVEQFRGQWLRLEPPSQTCLGMHGVLGIDSIAGESVWDVQCKFRVRVGPMGLEQFVEFLPDRTAVAPRKSLFLFAQLTRLFVGPELDFDVQLVLASNAVPECQLEETEGFGFRLGWNTWLISAPPPADADDAVFDGEWVVRV